MNELCIDIPATIRQVAQELGFGENDFDVLQSAVVDEVEKRCSELVRLTTMNLALPLMARKIKGMIRKRGILTEYESEEIAECLAQVMYCKLFGNWPRGNLNAFIWMHIDFCCRNFIREKEYERARLGNRVALNDERYSFNDEISFLDELADLPPDIRQRVEDMRSGTNLNEKVVCQSEIELKTLIQSIGGPDVGSSRRKRRRRKS